jgi:ABC-type branched-subunit amino acid transport system substrate-binding protein
LPVIFPVSTSVKLSEVGGKYTFRTVPSDKQAAEKLADYMIKPDKLNKKKAAVLFNAPTPQEMSGDFFIWKSLNSMIKVLLLSADPMQIYLISKT